MTEEEKKLVSVHRPSGTRDFANKHLPPHCGKKKNKAQAFMAIHQRSSRRLDCRRRYKP